MNVDLTIVGPALPTNITGVILSTSYSNPSPYNLKFETFSGPNYNLTYLGASNAGLPDLDVLSVALLSFSTILSGPTPVLTEIWDMSFNLSCDSPGGSIALTYGLTWTGIPALNSIPNGLNFTIVLQIVPSQSFCSVSSLGGATLSGTLQTFSDSAFTVSETAFNLDQNLYFEASLTDSTFGIHNVTLLDLVFYITNQTTTDIITNQVAVSNIQYTIITPIANNLFNFRINLNDTVFLGILGDTKEQIQFTGTFATWLVPQGSEKRSVNDGSSGFSNNIALNAAVNIKTAAVASGTDNYIGSSSAKLNSFLDMFGIN